MTRVDDPGDLGGPSEEELAAGTDRPPMRRRTRLALGGIAFAAVAAAVVVGVSTATDTPSPRPTTTRYVPSANAATPVRTFAEALPGTVPRPALTAVRSYFPGAQVTGFSAARAADNGDDVYLSYNITAGRRFLTIVVGPPRPGDRDLVFRTANSVGIAQPLARSRVRIQLTTTRGAPSARDFAVLQRLVQDTRLLAEK